MFIGGFSKIGRGQFEITPLFGDDLFKKIAVQAIEQFLGSGALRFTAAEGAGDPPAKTPAMFSMVDALEMTWHGNGTETKFRDFISARISAAILYFPAIFLPVHFY